MRRLGWVLVFLAAACMAPGERGAASRSAGFATAPSAPPPGTVVSLDDVTNGLVDTPLRKLKMTFPEDAGAGPADRGDASAAPPKERLLIHQGDVRVEVARADDASRAFLARVEQWGGYLQSQTGTALVVRVPAARFDEAFAAVKAAGRVLSEQRKADDVTEEYVDLGIRLDNATRARDRLLEVLKMATAVEDILKVEAELRRLTEEIERMEGRVKFLRDQVAMATLRAEFRSAVEAPPGQRARRSNRFHWINRVGAEAVMEDF